MALQCYDKTCNFEESCYTSAWDCSVFQFDEKNDKNWFSETKVIFQNTDIKICLSVQNSECLFNKCILPLKILLFFDRCAFKNCMNFLSSGFNLP